jgi:hypothetical protein
MEITSHKIGELQVWIQVLPLIDSCFVYVGTDSAEFDNLVLGIARPNSSDIAVAAILNSDQTVLTEKLCRRTGKVVALSLNVPNPDPMTVNELEHLIARKVGVRLTLPKERFDEF